MILVTRHGAGACQSIALDSGSLLHQPAGSVYGPAADIAIEAHEIIKMRERLNQIIATETGQSVERVRKDTERNYWMSASEAVEYGLAHKIVRSIEELK